MDPGSCACPSEFPPQFYSCFPPPKNILWSTILHHALYKPWSYSNNLQLRSQRDTVYIPLEAFILMLRAQITSFLKHFFCILYSCIVVVLFLLLLFFIILLLLLVLLQSLKPLKVPVYDLKVSSIACLFVDSLLGKKQLLCKGNCDNNNNRKTAFNVIYPRMKFELSVISLLCRTK